MLCAYVVAALGGCTVLILTVEWRQLRDHVSDRL